MRTGFRVRCFSHVIVRPKNKSRGKSYDSRVCQDDFNPGPRSPWNIHYPFFQKLCSQLWSTLKPYTGTFFVSNSWPGESQSRWRSGGTMKTVVRGLWKSLCDVQKFICRIFRTSAATCRELGLDSQAHVHAINTVYCDTLQTVTQGWMDYHLSHGVPWLHHMRDTFLRAMPCLFTWAIERPRTGTVPSLSLVSFLSTPFSLLNRTETCVVYA